MPQTILLLLLHNYLIFDSIACIRTGNSTCFFGEQFVNVNNFALQIRFSYLIQNFKNPHVEFQYVTNYHYVDVIMCTK